MKAKIYCLASAKGGSGKTIIAANFARFLTALGKKCLVIDCDSATHGLTLLYLHEVHEKVSSADDHQIFSGIFDDADVVLGQDVIQVENGVDFLPATYHFEILEELSGENFAAKLQRVLSSAIDSYDYIFLDAQAGSDAISRAAMKKEVSDEVIIVSEYDPLSAAGIERLKNIVGKDLEFTRTWVLLNKMLPEFVEKFSDFLSVTKYLPPIPWNADVVRAYSRKRLAIDTEYGNEYTLAIIQTLKVLLGEKISLQIDAWADERASNIRQPLETQYLDAEKELAALLRAEEYFRVSKLRRILLFFFTLILALFSSVFAVNYILKEMFSGISLLLKREAVNVGLLVVVLSVIVTYFFILMKKFSTIEAGVERARFKRKIEVLEERLKQLEALRKADFKTLIKQNK